MKYPGLAVHVALHNVDLIKTGKEEQIDVLETKYQKEIEDNVTRIAKFKLTIIVIEGNPSEQARYDSLYNQYLQGN